VASVTLENVRKIYPGGVEAVKGVSLEVADGAFVVLVGPSGCGKSTLLRMIAGLETVSSGEIRIGGRAVNEVEPAERDIAMVFQNYALYPHMSVHANMAYGLKNRGMAKPEIERRIGEAARLLGIEALLERKPRALSGGQRQRVAMGRAIVRNPQAFLFDEPLSNLDAKLRVSTRMQIRQLHDRLRATSIFVTHDQVEAMTLADTVVVMNEGAIEQMGAPTEVYRRPATRFVATFIGSPAMNLLPGRVVSPGVVEIGSGGAKLHYDVQQFEAAPGTEVEVGIRPEDLVLPDNGGASASALTHSEAGQAGAALSIERTFVEELGAVRVLHGTAGGVSIAVLQPAANSLPPSATMQVVAQPGAIHLFDRVTGRALAK
jgi:sn-glycerol 3-phosphate transport system ATP-binding protein